MPLGFSRSIIGFSEGRLGISDYLGDAVDRFGHGDFGPFLKRALSGCRAKWERREGRQLFPA
jgi:hypothetical protein